MKTLYAVKNTTSAAATVKVNLTKFLSICVKQKMEGEYFSSPENGEQISVEVRNDAKGDNLLSTLVVISKYSHGGKEMIAAFGGVFDTSGKNLTVKVRIHGLLGQVFNKPVKADELGPNLQETILSLLGVMEGARLYR